MGNVEKCGMTGKVLAFLISAVFVSKATFAADGDGPPIAAELNEVTENLLFSLSRTSS